MFRRCLFVVVAVSVACGTAHEALPLTNARCVWVLYQDGQPSIARIPEPNVCGQSRRAWQAPPERFLSADANEKAEHARIASNVSERDVHITLTEIDCEDCVVRAGTMVYVDYEVMMVSGAYRQGWQDIPVVRGQLGTRIEAHHALTHVYYGPLSVFQW